MAIMVYSAHYSNTVGRGHSSNASMLLVDASLTLAHCMETMCKNLTNHGYVI